MSGDKRLDVEVCSIISGSSQDGEDFCDKLWTVDFPLTLRLPEDRDVSPTVPMQNVLYANNYERSDTDAQKAEAYGETNSVVEISLLQTQMLSDESPISPKHSDLVERLENHPSSNECISKKEFTLERVSHKKSLDSKFSSIHEISSKKDDSYHSVSTSNECIFQVKCSAFNQSNTYSGPFGCDYNTLKANTASDERNMDSHGCDYNTLKANTASDERNMDSHCHQEIHQILCKDWTPYKAENGNEDDTFQSDPHNNEGVNDRCELNSTADEIANELNLKETLNVDDSSQQNKQDKDVADKKLPNVCINKDNVLENKCRHSFDQVIQNPAGQQSMQQVRNENRYQDNDGKHCEIECQPVPAQTGMFNNERKFFDNNLLHTDIMCRVDETLTNTFNNGNEDFTTNDQIDLILNCNPEGKSQPNAIEDSQLDLFDDSSSLSVSGKYPMGSQHLSKDTGEQILKSGVSHPLAIGMQPSLSQELSQNALSSFHSSSVSKVLSSSNNVIDNDYVISQNPKDCAPSLPDHNEGTQESAQVSTSYSLSLKDYTIKCDEITSLGDRNIKPILECENNSKNTENRDETLTLSQHSDASTIIFANSNSNSKVPVSTQDFILIQSTEKMMPNQVLINDNSLAASINCDRSPIKSMCMMIIQCGKDLETNKLHEIDGRQTDKLSKPNGKETNILSQTNGRETDKLSQTNGREMDKLFQTNGRETDQLSQHNGRDTDKLSQTNGRQILESAQICDLNLGEQITTQIRTQCPTTPEDHLQRTYDPIPSQRNTQSTEDQLQNTDRPSLSQQIFKSTNDNDINETQQHAQSIQEPILALAVTQCLEDIVATVLTSHKSNHIMSNKVTAQEIVLPAPKQIQSDASSTRTKDQQDPLQQQCRDNDPISSSNATSSGSSLEKTLSKSPSKKHTISSAQEEREGKLVSIKRLDRLCDSINSRLNGAENNGVLDSTDIESYLERCELLIVKMHSTQKEEKTRLCEALKSSTMCKEERKSLKTELRHLKKHHEALMNVAGKHGKIKNRFHQLKKSQTQQVCSMKDSSDDQFMSSLDKHSSDINSHYAGASRTCGKQSVEGPCRIDHVAVSTDVEKFPQLDSVNRNTTLTMSKDLKALKVGSKDKYENQKNFDKNETNKEDISRNSYECHNLPAPRIVNPTKNHTSNEDTQTNYDLNRSTSPLCSSSNALYNPANLSGNNPKSATVTVTRKRKFVPPTKTKTSTSHILNQNLAEIKNSTNPKTQDVTVRVSQDLSTLTFHKDSLEKKFSKQGDSNHDNTEAVVYVDGVCFMEQQTFPPGSPHPSERSICVDDIVFTEHTDPLFWMKYSASKNTESMPVKNIKIPPKRSKKNTGYIECCNVDSCEDNSIPNTRSRKSKVSKCKSSNPSAITKKSLQSKKEKLQGKNKRHTDKLSIISYEESHISTKPTEHKNNTTKHGTLSLKNVDITKDKKDKVVSEFRSTQERTKLKKTSCDKAPSPRNEHLMQPLTSCQQLSNMTQSPVLSMEPSLVIAPINSSAAKDHAHQNSLSKCLTSTVTNADSLPLSTTKVTASTFVVDENMLPPRPIPSLHQSTTQPLTSDHMSVSLEQKGFRDLVAMDAEEIEPLMPRQSQSQDMLLSPSMESRQSLSPFHTKTSMPSVSSKDIGTSSSANCQQPTEHREQSLILSPTSTERSSLFPVSSKDIVARLSSNSQIPKSTLNVQEAQTSQKHSLRPLQSSTMSVGLSFNHTEPTSRIGEQSELLSPTSTERSSLFPVSSKEIVARLSSRNKALNEESRQNCFFISKPPKDNTTDVLNSNAELSYIEDPLQNEGESQLQSTVFSQPVAPNASFLAIASEKKDCVRPLPLNNARKRKKGKSIQINSQSTQTSPEQLAFINHNKRKLYKDIQLDQESDPVNASQMLRIDSINKLSYLGSVCCSDDNDVRDIINRLTTVRLISDHELMYTDEDIPPMFWELDFSQITMSKKIWDSVTDWI